VSKLIKGTGVTLEYLGQCYTKQPDVQSFTKIEDWDLY